MDLDHIDVSKIPEDRLREILESHQDTFEMEVGSSTYRLYYGGASFDVAQKHDVDLNELMEVEHNATPQRTIKKLSLLLFVGNVVFNPEVTPEEFAIQITFQNFRDIQREVLEKGWGFELDEFEQSIKKKMDRVLDRQLQNDNSDKPATDAAQSPGNSQVSES